MPPPNNGMATGIRSFSTKCFAKIARVKSNHDRRDPNRHRTYFQTKLARNRDWSRAFSLCKGETYFFCEEPNLESLTADFNAFAGVVTGSVATDFRVADGTLPFTGPPVFAA